MTTVTIVLSPRPSETGTWLALAECPAQIPTYLEDGTSGGWTVADLDREGPVGRGADPCKAVEDLQRRMLADQAGMGAHVVTKPVPQACPGCLRPW